LGEIILGSVVGIVVEVEVGLVELPSVGPVVGVAAAMLDSMESDLALSVPVGLMLWGAVVETSEDVKAGMMDCGAETCDVELAIAGVMLGGTVLFPVEGAVGAERLSVDTGTTETSVLEVGTVLL
jgi:hypothetical protein